MLRDLASQTGVSENFGDEECKKIEEKFIDITDESSEMCCNLVKLNLFKEWCMSYSKKGE